MKCDDAAKGGGRVVGGRGGEILISSEIMHETRMHVQFPSSLLVRRQIVSSSSLARNLCVSICLWAAAD